jgi:GMP synthase (glutamine-hydrolysing)
MSHGDKVSVMPEGFVKTSQTETAPVTSFEHVDKPIFGIQFHAEVEHTKQGRKIFDRFLFDISGCEKLWKTDNIIAEHVESIRKKAGSDKVLLGLSGGVDSSVVAALLHQAIGDNLVCVFVDTGLLRYKEGDQVMETMAKGMDINVIRVNAQERYYAGLKGVSDPEAKRKVIGNLFIKIFEEEARKLEDVKWLAQGTIYPDVIESAASATGKSHVIKSHHNVGGLPADMELKLLEPLRDLFKDEVRKMGVALGLPKAMVYRHPFPGPGLGVRILGEVKPQYAEILARADHIFITELVNWDLYDKTSQAFAVFLPVKSVGVVGDARRYEYVITLRAVETIDFMTAKWAHLPYDFLELVSRRIINEIDKVSRVVYDISSKPPATIEWE